jgi:voltage-gated potassium channel
MQNADRLARLERWTEIPLTILAVVLIPILLGPYLVSTSPQTDEILTGIDYMIWGIFAADLIAKLALAPRRLEYLRRHWIDVLLVVIPFFRPLRVLRSTRLLRAGRVAVVLGRAAVGGKRIFTRHGLHYTLAGATGVVIVSGFLVTAAERGDPDATIRDVADGLWWAMTTITTVGFGAAYPTTALGRGVGVFLMVVGVALFSVVTANVAAFFVEEREDELLTEIRALRKEMRSRDG